MNIYVDESGSFANTTTPNSWCVIAAYVSPESDRKSLANLIGDLKGAVDGFPKEVKLGMLDESKYFDFLLQLGKLNGTVFVAATDMSQNIAEIVAGHRETQGLKIVEHIDKMRHIYGRDVAVLPLPEVASVIAAGGFESPVLFFQSLLIHAWYARRNTILRSHG